MTKLTVPFRNVANAPEKLDFFPEFDQEMSSYLWSICIRICVESAICGISAVRTRRPQNCD
jgi:hypothetical protein